MPLSAAQGKEAISFEIASFSLIDLRLAPFSSSRESDQSEQPDEPEPAPCSLRSRVSVDRPGAVGAGTERSRRRRAWHIGTARAVRIGAGSRGADAGSRPGCCAGRTGRRSTRRAGSARR